MSNGRRDSRPEYTVWLGMKRRCSPGDSRAKDYYDRGIRVAQEWWNDFEAFYAHVGPRPTPRHQIDRINNDGSYEPGNVRWATPAQNTRNTRRNVLITIDGVTKCATDWDLHCGFTTGRVKNRYVAGWRGARLLTPVVDGKTLRPAGERRVNGWPSATSAKRVKSVITALKKRHGARLVRDLEIALEAATVMYG